MMMNSLGLFGFGMALVALAACAPTPETGRTAPSPVASLTASADGASEEGYARADGPRAFDFPADHGPHPEFQTEWWYLTGHLDAEDGRRFGLQWTLFRRAVEPEMDDRDSAWATRQVYLGHFAVTDVASDRHHSYERLTRGGAGLAGARFDPEQDTALEVWLEDWSLTSGPIDPESTEGFPWTLTARGHDVSGQTAVSLEIEPMKPLVLQGDGGFSQKNSMPGGASYYYSFTRLDARGTLEIGGETLGVTGSAWLDREWSTSVLAPNQAGWDWFALQLEDGRDLMLYQLRLENGAADPASSGVLVDPDGTAERLALADFTLEPTAAWTADDGTAYPTTWRVRVPGHGLDLEVRPLVDDQELDVAFRYWEGAMDVEGTANGAPIAGRGYLELVGYRS